MKFYSHAKEVNGVKTGSKLLKQHLNGVFDKALSLLYPELNIDIDNQNITDILLDLTCLHDLGKYTTFFQRYLLGEKINQNLKSHSLIGAIYLLNKYKENPFYAALLYFLVINHHSNFQNILNTGIFVSNIEENNFILSQIKTIKNSKQDIEKEIQDLDVGSFLKIPEQDTQKNTRKTIKRIIIKNPNVQNYFTINYLFSLLIESDKLDASETAQYVRKVLPEKAVENFIGKAELNELPGIDEISGFEQNELRNWVRAAVLENLNDEKILNHNIFTLTAPTGIGKTLTALDFSLRLKKKIREKEKFEPQIIYGLPFINIIEQGLNVYKEVFKDTDINILGHYQYADIFGKDKQNESYNQKLMQLNTWQSDIVITSFVQFFETLISNRNKMLLKFNHLAGAIVILDEVQTLRLEQLPVIGATLYFLTKYLNTRLILMTATKPKIFDLANEQILKDEEEDAESFELLNDHELVFSKFNRTKIIPILDKQIIRSEDFYDIFSEKRASNKSCLVVCNTVQRSIDIFNVLKEGGVSNLYYLSTNIVPAVRLQIIEDIKTGLVKGKNPVLISTQVIEAGVDLDFDMGFRDLGPIDSIVQVAGRINRENDKDRELSPLYIVQFKNEKGMFEAAQIYDRITRDQVLVALKDTKEIHEKDYLKLVEKYFSNIADRESYSKSRKLFESMKVLRYDSDISEDYPVTSFKIIEESSWAISVFIELNEAAIRARQAYGDLLNKEISKEEFDKNFKKTFNQYIIAIPERFTNHLENINEFTERIKLVRFNNLLHYYNLETGFKRDKISEVHFL